MSFDSALRRRLYIRRISMNVSQRQLAARMRCTQSYVSDLENGRHEPGISMLARWAEGLDLRLQISLDVVEEERAVTA